MENNVNEVLVNDLIGWTCPKCGRILSPMVTMCPCGMHNPDTVKQEYEFLEHTPVDGKPLNS